MDIYRMLLDALPVPVWTVVLGLLVVFVLAVMIGSLRGRFRRQGGSLDRQRSRSSRWAIGKDLEDLWEDESERDPRKIGLGRQGKRWLVNTGLHRSKMIVAPTGAGKTPRVVVPDVLLHHGPAVVASIKSDALHLTIAHRRKQGPVWVIDSSGDSGELCARWSPLDDVHDYVSAVDRSFLITKSSRRNAGQSTANEQFWETLARKLIAPLLLAAKYADMTMPQVGEWIDSHDEQVPATILEKIGNRAATSAWEGFRQAEAKTKANMLASAATIFEAWTHPVVAGLLDSREGHGDGPVVDLDRLVSSEDGERATLYLVGTRDRQEILSPIFECLAAAIVNRLERAHQHSGLPLSPPLLMMLDEAANIARVRDLDSWASALAGQGMILVTVWQDEAQIRDAYGADRAAAIIANHTAKEYLPGISDQSTLEALSKRIGTAEFQEVSVSSGRDRWQRSTTISTNERDVAPTPWLEEAMREKDRALLLVAGYKPALITVPGWWETERLRELIPAETAEGFDALYAPRHKQPRRRRAQLASTGE